MNSGPACASYRPSHAVLQQPASVQSPERTRTPLQPSNQNTPTKSGGRSPQRGMSKFGKETPKSKSGVETSQRASPSRPHTPSKLPLGPHLADPETHSVSGHSHSPAPSPIKAMASPSKFASHAADPALQKQYADAVAKISTITSDYKHLEGELAKKSNKVAELTQKVISSEKILRNMEDDHRKGRSMQDREVSFYKESLEELQRMNLRLSSKIDANKASAEARLQEHETKYLTLLRSYKALQSNLELEQNSKALLIEQIEYLTKERDFLLQNSNPRDSLEASLKESLNSEHIDILNNSDFHDSSNSDFDASDFESDSDSDGSVRGTGLMMSFQELKPEDFESSSPIKAQTLKQADFQKGIPSGLASELSSPSNSFDVSRNYQFPAPAAAFRAPSFSGRTPPSPEPSAKAIKRQSLPAKFKTHEESELVLFPMKLASQANLSYFEEKSSAEASQLKRHSLATSRRFSKPSHSRYNSHDIVPIRVEFEAENIDGQALLSATSSELASVAESCNPIKDSCDEAFMKLSGYSRPESATASSSKRSSVWSDANLSSGDVTKQEITKLKFELQSLKLHNEKLLSYIGFELQKQKKNIKKLSSKQNLRGKSTLKGMEYSDAKLIEKSKDMLIHKKRVLRSVSINPSFSRNKPNFDCVGLGAQGGNEEDDTFAFKSHFIDSLAKEPGLRNNFSDASVKKYKSQTFRGPHTKHCFSVDSDESVAEEAEEIDMGIDELPHNGEGEWDSGSEGVVSDVDFDKLTRFNQMRYMIFGKEHMKKEKAIEAIADEGLKYKFLTIALGIVVVAVQVTSSAQHSNR